MQKLIVFGYGSLFDVAQVVFHDLQYCKNLKSFKLAEYGDEPLPQACPTSVLINTIGTTLPHLEELAFCSNCIDINFELAQMMALNFTNLRSFTICKYYTFLFKQFISEFLLDRNVVTIVFYLVA